MILDRTKQWAAFEDTKITLMDRVKNLSGAYVTQASIDTMTYRVDQYASEIDARKCSNGTEIIDDTSLTVSDCIFDTLQTAAPWDSDSDELGYNVKVALPKTAQPTGDRWHRVEITLTPISGADDAFPLVWLINTLAMGGT